MSNGNGSTTLEIRNEPTLLTVAGSLTPPSGGGGELTPVNPHEVLIGPSTGSTPALPTFRPQVAADIPIAAILTLPNQFTNVNRIPGLRVNTVIRTSNFTLGSTDFENWVNATNAQITALLPPAVGTGQIYRIKKADQTTNLVIINAVTGDFIDGDTQVVLRDWKDELVVIDASLHVWDRFNAPIPEPVDLTDYARLSIPNEFLARNLLHGLGLSPRLITTNGQTLSDEDSEVLVDATVSDLNIFLPASSGEGQWYHIKKVDVTNHIVSVIAAGTDTIDGSSSINFEKQWAECTLIDGQTGYWDNVGAGPPVEVPTVFQIGQWARFVETNSPNGIALELFNGTSWVQRWKEVV
jgi:hypothetical protein